MKMIDPLKALRSGLADGPNPLCIESFTGPSPSGQLRSSNSTYTVPLTYEAVSQPIVSVKSFAALDASEPPSHQEGTFALDGHLFPVHCYPQPDGEILVLHRKR